MEAQPIILQCPVGPMANFAYILGDPVTRTAAVVDPGWEAERLLTVATEQRLRPTLILLTHNHFDHIGALEALCGLMRPAAVYVHAADAGGLPALACPVVTTEDAATIPVGELMVRCLHTPGHTPGGQCFLVGSACLTGDTLFVDGCGRVDLPGSDPDAMFRSLRVLAALPAETTIYCGHDYGPTPTSTIGQQVRTNPYLRAASQDDFFRARGV